MSLNPIICEIRNDSFYSSKNEIKEYITDGAKATNLQESNFSDSDSSVSDCESSSEISDGPDESAHDPQEELDELNEYIKVQKQISGVVTTKKSDNITCLVD